MTNLDFEISEFDDRQQRTRAAMEKIGIDLLIVTHPVNINYLVGSRIKGYQEFQALLFTLEPSDLILQTRFADVFEAQELFAVEGRAWVGPGPGRPRRAHPQVDTGGEGVS